MKHQPKTCETCGQTLTYALSLSKGVAHIMIAMRTAILAKGRNIVHPMSEIVVGPKDWSVDRMLQDGSITPTMYGNFRFATSHGLLAKVDNRPGNYCVTRKGAGFCRGDAVERIAIIDKRTGHKVKYWDEDSGHVELVTISQLLREDGYWRGPDFDIWENQIVVKTNKQIAII